MGAQNFNFTPKIFFRMGVSVANFALLRKSSENKKILRQPKSYGGQFPLPLARQHSFGRYCRKQLRDSFATCGAIQNVFSLIDWSLDIGFMWLKLCPASNHCISITHQPLVSHVCTKSSLSYFVIFMPFLNRLPPLSKFAQYFLFSWYLWTVQGGTFFETQCVG